MQMQEKVIDRLVEFPYLASLAASPDQTMLAWVRGGGPGAFEVCVVNTETKSNHCTFTYPAAKYPPVCTFIGNERLAVTGHRTDELKLSNVSLFDTKTGSCVSQIDIPDCYFSYPECNPCAQELAGESGLGGLIIVGIANDSLSPRRVNAGQIYRPGPKYSPGGELYYLHHYALHVLRNNAPLRLMDGDHCICFGDKSDIYCGGGYSDRSGPSKINCYDLTKGSTRAIDWGREPVDYITSAGPGQILVGSGSSSGYDSNMSVCLVDVASERRMWSCQFAGMRTGINPLVLAIPDGNLLITQSANDVNVLSLQQGQLLKTLQPKAKDERIMAIHLHKRNEIAVAIIPWNSAPSRIVVYGIR